MGRRHCDEVRRRKETACQVVAPDWRVFDRRSRTWWRVTKVTSGGMVQFGKGRAAQFFCPSRFVPWRKAKSYI